MNRRLIVPEPPAPPTVHQIVDALESARQILAEQHGLAKRNAAAWVGDWPCFCTVAALTVACRTKAIRDEATKAVLLALGPRWRSIEAYNDAPHAECGCGRWMQTARLAELWMQFHPCGEGL